MILDIVGLQISVPEFILTIISFFLFMFLLNKFLFKPVLSFMDARHALTKALPRERKPRPHLKRTRHSLHRSLLRPALMHAAL